MDGALNAIAALVLAVPFVAAFTLLGWMQGQSSAMREALDRGYAVQCVGKSGIYWECE